MNSPIPILRRRQFDAESRYVVIVREGPGENKVQDSGEVIRLQFDSSQRFADFSDAAPAVKVYGTSYRDKSNRLCVRVEKIEHVSDK